ncbi:hypothetical protein GIB67_034998 [Kingdonia uniflora]|uniref:Inositol oxygenase n=1 Tax=Kingdonia uniflora TaxID=39325 RepID=A0A7J7NH16_9MAGN|nr:hypothetical protein GIB67_034998 [Kingdonia uniflora]
MREEYGKLDRVEMSIWECCELLNEFIDESDPDLDEPQMEHLLQTAKAIRRDYDNEDWLHIVGLIHEANRVKKSQKIGRSAHSFSSSSSGKRREKESLGPIESNTSEGDGEIKKDPDRLAGRQTSPPLSRSNPRSRATQRNDKLR